MGSVFCVWGGGSSRRRHTPHTTHMHTHTHTHTTHKQTHTHTNTKPSQPPTHTRTHLLVQQVVLEEAVHALDGHSLWGGGGGGGGVGGGGPGELLGVGHLNPATTRAWLLCEARRACTLRGWAPRRGARGAAPCCPAPSGAPRQRGRTGRGASPQHAPGWGAGPRWGGPRTAFPGRSLRRWRGGCGVGG